MFGPQKGASVETVERLASALERYADVIERDTGKDVREMPGGGASGGLGAGLHAFLGAILHPRYEIVMRYLNIDRMLRGADLVFTAEGESIFKLRAARSPLRSLVAPNSMGCR